MTRSLSGKRREPPGERTGRLPPLPGARVMALPAVPLEHAVLDVLPGRIAVLDQEGSLLAVNARWRDWVCAQGDAAGEQATIGRPLAWPRLWCPEVYRVAGSASEATPGEIMQDGARAVIEGRQAAFSTEIRRADAADGPGFRCEINPLRPPFRGVVLYIHEFDMAPPSALGDGIQGDALARVERLESVGAFASTLIHELFQPLTAVKLFAQSLQLAWRTEPLPREKAAAALTALQEQVDRIFRLVTDLRRFMRRDGAGSQRFDVRLAVRQAVDLMTLMAREKTVDLRVILPSAAVYLLGSQIQIEQVLVNLIANAIEAIEAIDEGGGALRLVQIAVWIDGQEVEVSVRDTGPGLACGRGDGEAVFTLFQTGKRDGIGIGLGLSRSLIQAHGGRLWLESSTPRGALFRFRLPIHALGME